MEEMVIKELSAMLNVYGQPLFRDELENLLLYLYAIIFRAASVSLERGGDPERIAATAFRQHALDRADAITGNNRSLSGQEPAEIIRLQLAALGLGESIIANAVDLRRQYHQVWLRNRGSEFGRVLQAVLGDVQAISSEESIIAIEDPAKGGRYLLQRVLLRTREHYEKRDLHSHGISLGLIHGMVFFLELTRFGGSSDLCVNRCWHTEHHRGVRMCLHTSPVAGAGRTWHVHTLIV
jgi:hypothetical protein